MRSLCVRRTSAVLILQHRYVARTRPIGPMSVARRSGNAHQFEVARLPTRVECRRRRPVDPEIGEPALPRDRLDPPILAAMWWLGTEVRLDGRPVRSLELDERAQRRFVLARADLAPTLGIIHGYRPEELRRHGLRHRELVRLRSVEIRTGRIAR